MRITHRPLQKRRNSARFNPGRRDVLFRFQALCIERESIEMVNQPIQLRLFGGSQSIPSIATAMEFAVLWRSAFNSAYSGSPKKSRMACRSGNRKNTNLLGCQSPSITSKSPPRIIYSPPCLAISAGTSDLYFSKPSGSCRSRLRTH